MGTFGDLLSETFSTEFEGEDTVDSLIKFKLKSTDFRRFCSNLGNKVENMRDSFEFIGMEIARFHQEHFRNNEGPDEDGNMISWPAYNTNKKTGKQEYLIRKLRDPDNAGGSKLLSYTGELEASLTPGGPGSIFNVSSRTLEIGSEVGVALLHNFGWEMSGRGDDFPSPEQLKRPIFGITENEQDQLMERWEEFFFGDL